MVSHPFPSLDNRLLLPHRKDSRHLLWSSLQQCPFVCPGPGPCSEQGATGDGDPLSPSLSRDFTRAAPASCRGSGSCKGSPVSWAHFRAGTAAGHSRHPVGGKPFLTASVTLRDSRSKQLWNYRLWNKISTELIPIDAQNFWCSSRVSTILPQNSWNTDALGKTQSDETLCVQTLRMLKPKSPSKSEN